MYENKNENIYIFIFNYYIELPQITNSEPSYFIFTMVTDLINYVYCSLQYMFT